MVTVKCLSCDADNDPRATGGYCDVCGKRLPPASSYRSARAAVVGPAGESELAGRPRQRTAEALLTAAVLALVGGGLYLIVGPFFLRAVPQDFLQGVLAVTLPPPLALLALSGLARSRPRPAAVAAVGLYLAWVALTLLLQPALAVPWMPMNVALLVGLGWVAWGSSR